MVEQPRTVPATVTDALDRVLAAQVAAFDLLRTAPDRETRDRLAVALRHLSLAWLAIAEAHDV